MGHFYGHAKLSEDIARNVLNRLKYDNLTKDSVLLLVKYHDLHLEESETAVKRLLRKIGPEMFRKLILLYRADNLAQSPEYRDRQAGYDRLSETADRILEEEQCFSLKDLAVSGHDIIDMGFEPGSRIGTILNDLLTQVIDGKLKNEKEELTGYVQKNYEP